LSATAASGCLVISLSYIIEGSLGLGGLVNPRVQESERRIASVESLLVEKRNDRRESTANELTQKSKQDKKKS